MNFFCRKHYNYPFYYYFCIVKSITDPYYGDGKQSK